MGQRFEFGALFRSEAMQGTQGEVDRGLAVITVMAKRTVEGIATLRAGIDLRFGFAGGDLLGLGDPCGNLTGLGSDLIGEIDRMEEATIVAATGIDEGAVDVGKRGAG